MLYKIADVEGSGTGLFGWKLSERIVDKDTFDYELTEVLNGCEEYDVNLVWKYVNSGIPVEISGKLFHQIKV